MHPDQGKSSPTEPTVSVLEGIVEAPSEGRISEDDNPGELEKDNICDDERLDRGLQRSLAIMVP